MTGPTPLTVAIVGAGPSGIYAAEALSQQVGVPVRVAVLDRLPVPFGLVRYGVAPDHHVDPLDPQHLGTDAGEVGRPLLRRRDHRHRLSVDELRGAVDAVIYAFGAGSDKRLDIPGEDLPAASPRPSSSPGTAATPTSIPTTSAAPAAGDRRTATGLAAS